MRRKGFSMRIGSDVCKAAGEKAWISARFEKSLNSSSSRREYSWNRRFLVVDRGGFIPKWVQVQSIWTCFFFCVTIF